MSKDSLVHDLTLALKHTVRQHPVLGTRILLPETENPLLCRAPHLDLRKHLRFIRVGKTGSKDSATDLQQLLAKAHNEPPLGYDEPQWRVFVAPVRFSASKSTYHFHLGFACSHALADGLSNALFHTTFVKALRDLPSLAQDSSLEGKCTTSEEPLPPSLNKAAKMPMSFGFLARGPIAAEILPRKAAGKLGALVEDADKAWYGAPKRPAVPKKDRLIKTGVHVAVIPDDVVRAALATCKKNGARLTGFLNHAMARALARALHSRGQEYRHFIVETAMDLRRLLPQGQNKMINYVAAHTELLSVGDTEDTLAYMLEDWSVVQRTTEGLSEASSRLRDQPVAMLKFLKNYRAYILKKANGPAEGSFISSNLGVFNGRCPKPDTPADNDSGKDIPQQQEWEIEQLTFSQSANGTGSALNMNVVSAVGGTLNITMTWWVGMLGVRDEQVFVRDVMDDVVGQLGIAAAQSNRANEKSLLRQTRLFGGMTGFQDFGRSMTNLVIEEEDKPEAHCTTCGGHMEESDRGVQQARRVSFQHPQRLSIRHVRAPSQPSQQFLQVPSQSQHPIPLMPPSQQSQPPSQQSQPVQQAFPQPSVAQTQEQQTLHPPPRRDSAQYKQKHVAQQLKLLPQLPPEPSIKTGGKKTLVRKEGGWVLE